MSDKPPTRCGISRHDSDGHIMGWPAWGKDTPPPQTLRVVSISGDPYAPPPMPVVDLGFVSPAAHLEKGSK